MEGKQPFDMVVAEHGATVLRVCRAAPGPVDADDAWSETFLSAMKAYPDLPADAKVQAWLVTSPTARPLTSPARQPAAPSRSLRLLTPRPQPLPTAAISIWPAP